MRWIRLFMFFLIALLAVLNIANLVYSDNLTLLLATTTSTDNTGLLDYLKPYIMADTGIKLHWVATGTGKAMALGKNCDVDMLLVHAPKAELEFIKDGYGISRHQIMYNDFVIIGPKSDPALIKRKPVSEAFHMIASKKMSFTSRGDDSGTHKKEISLWKSAGLTVPDRESWYYQTGQGMLTTISIAEELDSYSINDRGTYIKYKSKWKGNPPLVILIEGDHSLLNQYSIIAVNPNKCEKVEYDMTDEFIKWIISPKAQKLIGDFKSMGKQLFIPNAHEN